MLNAWTLRTNVFFLFTFWLWTNFCTKIRAKNIDEIEPWRLISPIFLCQSWVALVRIISYQKCIRIYHSVQNQHSKICFRVSMQILLKHNCIFCTIFFTPAPLYIAKTDWWNWHPYSMSLTFLPCPFAKNTIINWN